MRKAAQGIRLELNDLWWGECGADSPQYHTIESPPPPKVSTQIICDHIVVFTREVLRR